MEKLNKEFEIVRKKIEKAKYIVLTGKMAPHSEHFDLYKNVYKLWTATWTKAFAAVGSPESFSPDNFYRQDYIPVIAYNDQPIAAHFYTLFYLDNPASIDHSYFEIFSESALQQLKAKQVQSLLSLEYLSVDPAYRKSAIGFSVAEVLSGLCCRFLKEVNCDAGLGVAVKAARIDKMAKNLGFELLDSDARRGNLVCDIVVKYSETVGAGVHPDPLVNSFVDSLWNNYVNFENPIKKIA